MYPQPPKAHEQGKSAPDTGRIYDVLRCLCDCQGKRFNRFFEFTHVGYSYQLQWSLARLLGRGGLTGNRKYRVGLTTTDIHITYSDMTTNRCISNDTHTYMIPYMYIERGRDNKPRSSFPTNQAMKKDFTLAIGHSVDVFLCFLKQWTMGCMELIC